MNDEEISEIKKRTGRALNLLAAVEAIEEAARLTGPEQIPINIFHDLNEGVWNAAAHPAPEITSPTLVGVLLMLGAKVS